MTAFCSLYLPCADSESVAGAIRAGLAALGYTPFDPFGIIPGKAYPQAVRLFVAPAHDGWTRVLGAPDPALLPPLSQIAPCLLIELDGGDARIEAFADGVPAAPEHAFAGYLASDHCLDQYAAPAEAPAALGGVALDALPGDVQALAQRIDLRQAGKMFDRMSRTLNTDPAAQDLLRQLDWSSPGAARIASWMRCLNISDWREPDFVTLRDAYALHVRRHRRPNATLYPGDAETLAAVPDALIYTPIYAGKR